MPKLEEVIRALAEAKVEFVLLGGMAAVAQGASYLTVDLDVCYSRSRENLTRLCDAVAPFSPALRGAPSGLPFRLDPPTVRAGMNFTLSTTAGDLDILGVVTGLGEYPEVLARSEKMPLFGLEVDVLTLDGLIDAKRAAGRPKDLRLLPELEALREMRKSKEK